MHNVFVYGTLKDGRGNHGLLTSPTTIKLGEATVKNLNLFYSHGTSGFPVSHVDEGSTITGEVYSVDDDTKLNLDYLESIPHMYTREETTATMIDGTVVETEFYLGTPDYWAIDGMNTNGEPCPTNGDGHVYY